MVWPTFFASSVLATVIDSCALASSLDFLQAT